MVYFYIFVREHIVVIGNIEVIKYYLSKFDSKDNKFRAYFLVLENSDEEIIDLIKNNVIERNFYGNEVFRTDIEEQLEFSTDLGKSLYNYSREL